MLVEPGRPLAIALDNVRLRFFFAMVLWFSVDILAVFRKARRFARA